MQHIHPKAKSFSQYKGICTDEILSEVEELASQLQGTRILNINATAFGGGVAEILHNVVPLMLDLGIKASWDVLEAPHEFYDVTKKFHNGLQGAPITLSHEELHLYEKVNRANARTLGEYDLVYVHDAQPLFIKDTLSHNGDTQTKWAWRCHVDTSNPNEYLSRYLMPCISMYDAAVYTMDQYVPSGLRAPVSIISPTIDPLDDKNKAMSVKEAARIVRGFGIDVDRPLLLQVSRFDPWKDPIGVIEAYRLVKKTYPDVQLALVGSMASDDPEGWEQLAQVVACVDGDRDIFVLTNDDGVGAVEVNAFQRKAAVVIQKSTREGFGLTVSEALWKASAVVAGNVGGIPLQVQHGVTGSLVSSIEECASMCIKVLQNPERSEKMALAGREHVRKNFLTPNILRDELKLFLRLLSERKAPALPVVDEPRETYKPIKRTWKKKAVEKVKPDSMF